MSGARALMPWYRHIMAGVVFTPWVPDMWLCVACLFHLTFSIKSHFKTWACRKFLVYTKQLIASDLKENVYTKGPCGHLSAVDLEHGQNHLAQILSASWISYSDTKCERCLDFHGIFRKISAMLELLHVKISLWDSCPIPAKVNPAIQISYLAPVRRPERV